ncbi:MAG: hypothetical protein LLF90_09345 [Methanomicrobiaceae archaeon]|uniref:hypothetical protein n=1 Tax=Methanoculleus sp. TaxID=90427 RepID=UPI00320F81B6|nr:hypothetical protein [Methanomicrobiaceae archaeon]
MPERVSPLAVRRITVGKCGGIGIDMIHPSTGDYYPYEGSLDEIAAALHRTGARLGCRAERRTVYWAVYEYCEFARRQAAARGVQE